jgi:rRNA maturation protein Rpf1
MLDLIRELLMVFPQSVYFERRDFEIKVIVEEANENGYTDIMVLNEDKISIRKLLGLV